MWLRPGPETNDCRLILFASCACTSATVETSHATMVHRTQRAKQFILILALITCQYRKEVRANQSKSVSKNEVQPILGNLPRQAGKHSVSYNRINSICFILSFYIAIRFGAMPQ